MFKYFLMASLALQLFFQSVAQQGYDTYPNYDGNDLGVTYTKTKTTFKVWSPKAETIKLRLFKDGYQSKSFKQLSFIKKDDGIWAAELNGDYKNVYYTYQAKILGRWMDEVPDIYAKAVGVNGKRGMVVDLNTTNPANWNADKSPNYGTMKDAVIYELHVRDATIFTNAKHKGKFLGLTEKGLLNRKRTSIGLDHIKKLGITHVQLLPSYDYFTVDETKKDNKQYNWGYDPLNYNVPEGSYSTNPYDGNVRIKEFKTLIKTFHDNGLNVIMDVVYNHTMFTEESYFNQLVPGYYYRQKTDGTFSNASGCNNETASDRAMYRKYMIESVLHWVKEYHIDGFRFDLMAIHDITTMNIIATELRKINPNIVLLGEGWTAGDSPLPDDQKALKRNAHLMKDVAVFSDDIRDALKGSVFDHHDSGFISGKSTNIEESIKFGLVGAIQHPQIDYGKVNYSKAPYTTQPYQMIAYNECHDNHTLWDRLLNSNPHIDIEERKRMYTLATSIVLTSQGIPFLHAGQEMCRTKNGDENSYKSSDSINGINWDRLYQFSDVHNTTQRLLAIRKAHNAFKLGTQELVAKHVQFIDAPNQVVIMHILNAPYDSWKNIYIVYNGSKSNYEFTAVEKNKLATQYLSYGSDNANIVLPQQCVIYTAQ
jgi:pullulanase